MKIAIDGPAGAGKSTIAKIVASKLGSIYIDTGAMYRAMALFMIRNGIDPGDGEAMEKLCSNCRISIAFLDGAQRVFLGDEDVTAYLRDEEVGKMASAVSKYPAVRTKLVELQRELAEKCSVVMDGRDIGTVVLPDAELKIYLTADPHVRAVRRAKELCGDREPDARFVREIEDEIILRDTNDMTREVSPLKKADDAVLVDSSYLSIDEVAGLIIDHANRVLKETGDAV